MELEDLEVLVSDRAVLFLGLGKVWYDVGTGVVIKYHLNVLLNFDNQKKPILPSISESSLKQINQETSNTKYLQFPFMLIQIGHA